MYCALKQPGETFETSKVEKRFTSQLKFIADPYATAVQLQSASSSKNESIRRPFSLHDAKNKFKMVSPKYGYNWGDNLGFLPFEIVLNLGNAIDYFGLLKAPQPGDYQFLFQCKLAAKDPNFKIDSIA